jgi:hypothetical protein
LALTSLQKSITGFSKHITVLAKPNVPNLKVTLAGFEYRISKHPDNDKINAIFWIFPEQRFDLVTYGSVLFVDATHGTPHYAWPLFTPCVLNSDEKLRPMGYCLLDSECDLSQAWLLTSILEIEPTWCDIVKAIFTDDKLSHDSVTNILPHVSTFLCWRDLENVRNCGRLRELPAIRDFVIANFVFGVSKEEIDNKWLEFQQTFPVKATEYMANWMNRRGEWCSPWWSVVFTCGRTCNSSAKCNNSALKVGYEVGCDTLCRLIMQTTERSCALRAQGILASDRNYFQSCSVLSSLTECAPLSLAAQIYECRGHWATHVGDSLERTITSGSLNYLAWCHWLPWRGTAYAVPQYPAVPVFIFFCAK